MEILLFLFFMLLFIYRIPAVKGYLGEASVKSKLSKLDQEKYFILNDVMIKTANGKTSQIDHVVVSVYGIFVIETKNYKGWITGNEQSQYWNQTIYKRKEKLLNPIIQNKGHVKALKDLLADYPHVPFIPIVVFGIRADLKMDVSSEVVYSTKLLDTILKYNNEVISLFEAKQIHNAISNANSVDKEERKAHVQTIKADIRERENKISNNICPRCGGSLVERRGKYGSFMGCANYPKCKFALREA